MPTIKKSILIEENPANLFHFANDFKIRYSWDPYLEKYDYTEGLKMDKGSKVWFETDKSEFNLEITQFTPNTFSSFKITDPDPPFRKISGHWKLEPQGSDSTQITLAYNFELLDGIWNKFLGIFSKMGLKSQIKNQLKGLRDYCE